MIVKQSIISLPKSWHPNNYRYAGYIKSGSKFWEGITWFLFKMTFTDQFDKMAATYDILSPHPFSLTWISLLARNMDKQVMKCPPTSTPQRDKNCCAKPDLKMWPTQLLTLMLKKGNLHLDLGRTLLSNVYQNWACI